MNRIKYRSYFLEFMYYRISFKIKLVNNLQFEWNNVTRSELTWALRVFLCF